MPKRENIADKVRCRHCIGGGWGLNLINYQPSRGQNQALLLRHCVWGGLFTLPSYPHTLFLKGRTYLKSKAKNKRLVKTPLNYKSCASLKCFDLKVRWI